MRNFIPEDYLPSHDYCFFLHDQLAGIVVSGEEEDIFSIRIEFEDEAHAHEMEGKSGEELVQWLEENGYREYVYYLFYKQICVALLSDFCHFVYEALECSRKGKLTVTYALLRKPFKENLFYLEWLLADPANFMKCFTLSNGNQFSAPDNVQRERKIQIIAEAMNKMEIGRWIEPDFIYQLRYDKRADYGLEQMWQKANHLITTFRSMKTEEQNFNFVFSGEDSRESQWWQLYSILPILLFYTLQVVNALVSTFAEGTPENDITTLRCIIGFFIWTEHTQWEIQSDEIQNVLSEAAAEIHQGCPNCDNVITLDQDNQKLMYEEGILECRECHHRVDLYQ